MMEPQYVFGAATWLAPEYRNQVRTRHRLLTTPGIQRRKKTKKPLKGVVCLLTRGGLIRVRLGAPPGAAARATPTQIPCARLLDHLVRLEEDGGGDREAQGLRGREVDDQLELRG